MRVEGELRSNGTSGEASLSRQRLLEDLQAEVGAGRVSVAILDHWRPLDAWLDDNPGALAELLTAAAEIDPAIGTAQTTAAKSIGVAMVGPQGQLRTADPRFVAWIGDPAASVACMRLVREAAAGRASVGLVDTTDHGVITVFATGGAAIEKWRDRSAPIAERDGAAAVAVALVAFAPSRSEEAVAQAANAYGLSPLESRLAAALLDAPTLELAAAAIGVGRETAKEALSGAMRKAGVTTAAQLVGRVMSLSCPGVDPSRDATAEIGAALGLSPTEARVARELGRGSSAKAVAHALRLSPQTVATYRRDIFSKTGVNRARDLGRLLVEVEGLERLASASEVVLDAPDARERLRVTVDADGRRIAFIDYGPASGRPVVLNHSATTGRTCPPPLLASLQASGRRVIAMQRPGFGLTQAAVRDYVETATADLAQVIDELGLERPDVLSRSSLTSLEFAARRPGRLGRLILVNPQPPFDPRVASNGPLALATRIVLEQPALIETFARMLGRQTRSDVVAGMLRRAVGDNAPDRTVVDDPVLLRHLVRDAQGLLGPSITGFAAEQRLLAGRWSPPATISGHDTVIVQGGALATRPAAGAWPTLTQARIVTLADAGWFAQFTHPDAFVELLDAPA